MLHTQVKVLSTGDNCENNINDCVSDGDSDLCSGRGVCVDVVNGYDCFCDPDWTGLDCGMPIDDCLSEIYIAFMPFQMIHMFICYDLVYAINFQFR